MQYFHRSPLLPAEALRQATSFFGARLSPTVEEPARREFAGTVGRITVAADRSSESGHATLVTVATDQPGESEADKLAKRFLTLLHATEDPGYTPIGAY